MNRRKQSGFTLIELMVALVLASGLLTIGATSLSTWRNDADLRETTSALRFYADQARNAYLAGSTLSTTSVGINPWGNDYWYRNDTGTGMAWTDVPLTGISPAGIETSSISGGTRLAAYGQARGASYLSSSTERVLLYGETPRW